MIKLFRSIYCVLTRHAGSYLFVNHQKHLWVCLCSMLETRSHKSPSASSLHSSLSVKLSPPRYLFRHLFLLSFLISLLLSSPELVLVLIKICHQVQINFFSLPWLIWCCHLEHEVEHISKWMPLIETPWKKRITKRRYSFQVDTALHMYIHTFVSSAFLSSN